VAAGWLSNLSVWDATWLACEWAASDDAWHRLAIARELAAPVRIAGVWLVLDVLCADRDPEVAAAAIHAVRMRGVTA